MSRGQTLRALVNERLATAAEDIFVLFERTIAEYEEQLCRCKEENQRKQQLLDQYPRMELVRGNVQIPSSNPGSSLNQEITETPWIKEEPEEQSVKQEEEQLPVPLPESSAVCVKTEESSLLQQRQTEHREETQGEDISSESHFHSETEGHAAPFSSSVFATPFSQNLDLHASPHTEKRFSCSFCERSFAHRSNLVKHIRIHTGEKPYSCTMCEKTFAQLSSLGYHTKTHTGEKPYSCPSCEKTFSRKSHLDLHVRTHTGEKPFSCSTCDKTFSRKNHLDFHMRIHTGEKPFSCTVCHKAFSQKSNLKSHMHTHRGQSVCDLE